MSPFRTPWSLSKILAITASCIFVILPFHAFLTVWLSSLAGHYTLLRLWKEILLLGLVLGAGYYLFIDKQLRKDFFGSLPVQLMGLYLLLVLLKTISGLLSSDVSAKAAGYGFVVDGRFIIFFLICVVLAKKTDLKKFNVKKWILVPAIVVSAFAVLQYLALPNDFLVHFGYGPDTILPYQTINHDTSYIRAISTLRGANPLGAYLVLIISLALSALLFARKQAEKRYLIGGLALYLGALAVSFSRSAWIGMLLSSFLIVWISSRSKKYRRIFIIGIATLICATLAAAVLLRNNTAVDNAIFHTNDNSVVQRSSNEDHASALDSALSDVAHNPLGGGVGSAGPASVYNSQPKISENYFLQIAQEIGWLGLVVFIIIYVYLAWLLWKQKAEPLALGLFAALVGLSFVNMLSHAWTDDTLAYLFFGLAGIALMPVILIDKSKHNGKK